VVDIVRQLRPAHPAIELVHRLDRETSGCLIFAKDYPSLRSQQAQLNKPDSQKTYLCLLRGSLRGLQIEVDSPLQTSRTGGEKRTVVDTAGKHAATAFKVLEVFANLSLVQATITTGRTHQIRVHAASLGHPVAGDTKYGDAELNARLRKNGLKRMFLHAAAVTIRPAASAGPTTVTAPLPDDLEEFLTMLRRPCSDS
jgi:23S rRNA pseudouridine955/2504/2580 synthase